MEVIFIDEGRLLLSLTPKEVEARGLDGEASDPKVQRALDRVLLDAEKQGGIALRTGKLAVELYLDRTGGCEIFITQETEGLEEGRAMEKGKSREREKLSPPRALYSLAQFEDVLTLAYLLHKRGYSAPAELWHGQDGVWFLLLEREGGEDGLATLAFVEEFATRHPSRDQIFFSEHATLILRDETISRLAVLDAKHALALRL
jgi:hypothetical protein